MNKKNAIEIAVIGAGWYGCYLAWKLKVQGYSVTVYEKNKEIFQGSSAHNQNRLHLGFHYMRSYTTRKECLDGYHKFIQEFPSLSKSISSNLYLVHRNSWMDLMTIRHILDAENVAYQDEPLPYPFLDSSGIEGVLRCEERVISPAFSKQTFEHLLSNELHLETVWTTEDHLQKDRFDYILYCTFEDHIFRNPSLLSCFRVECCLSLIYECTDPRMQDTALTVIDGPFFSLYPYHDRLFTLTHVEHTVLVPDLQSIHHPRLCHPSGLDPSLLQERRDIMEKCVLQLFPSFLDSFHYHSFFISYKCKKRHTTTDDRSVVVFRENEKEIFVCGGKITGVFEAFEHVHDLILQDGSSPTKGCSFPAPPTH